MKTRRGGWRWRVLGAAMVLGGLGAGSGCVATAPGSGGGVPTANGSSGDPQSASASEVWQRDAAAVRAMSGVFDVSITVASGPAGQGQSVRAREAVLAETGTLPGQIVLEHLLLVGQPAAVARHWSAVWTPTDNGSGGVRWTVVESEADGRPSSVAEGTWVHEALGVPTDGIGGLREEAVVSRFVPAAGSVRETTTRSPGLDEAVPGRWWASTVTRVGPGSDWTRTTEGQLLGPAGRPTGGSVTRTEAYTAVEPGLAAAALATAASWWEVRSAFWSAVRGWWEARGAVAVREQVEGRPMWRAVLDLEAAVRRGEAVADAATLDAVLGAYVARGD